MSSPFPTPPQDRADQGLLLRRELPVAAGGGRSKGLLCSWAQRPQTPVSLFPSLDCALGQAHQNLSTQAALLKPKAEKGQSPALPQGEAQEGRQITPGEKTAGQGLTLEVQQARRNLNETQTRNQSRWSLTFSKSGIHTNAVLSVKVCRSC